MVSKTGLTWGRNELIEIPCSELHLDLLMTSDSNPPLFLRIYQSDRNVMISAPTGAGKTVCQRLLPVLSIAHTPRRSSSNLPSSDSSRPPALTPKLSTSLPPNLSAPNAPPTGSPSSHHSAGTWWSSRAIRRPLGLSGISGTQGLWSLRQRSGTSLRDDGEGTRRLWTSSSFSGESCRSDDADGADEDAVSTRSTLWVWMCEVRSLKSSSVG